MNADNKNTAQDVLFFLTTRHVDLLTSSPGIEHIHPALKGKVLTVEPPGKSLYGIFCNISSFISDFMYLSSRSFFLVSLAKILSILFINSKKLLNFLYPSIVILDSISFIVASSLLFPSSSNSGGFPVGSVVKNPPANAEDEVWPLGWNDPLKEVMATCSSILAWETPWTEEPGRL